MRREAAREGNSSPYSQHSKLLEPSEVILMDPSDIVAIELSGRERGKGTGEMGALDPWGSAQTPLHLAQLRPLTLPAKKSNRPKPLCSPHSSSSNSKHGSLLEAAETLKHDSTSGTQPRQSSKSQRRESGNRPWLGHSGAS